MLDIKKLFRCLALAGLSEAMNNTDTMETEDSSLCKELKNYGLDVEMDGENIKVYSRFH